MNHSESILRKKSETGCNFFFTGVEKIQTVDFKPCLDGHRQMNGE